MNEIFERVSIRRYTEEPVSQEILTKIIRAGMAAPSAGNQQPWEFYAVTDRETICALSGISPYAACAKNAPAVIVPCYRTEGNRWQETVLLDLSAATENMLLEITSLGLGGVWLCAAPLADRMEKAAQALSLPPTLQAFAVIAVGYPAETRRQQERFDAARIHFV